MSVRLLPQSSPMPQKLSDWERAQLYRKLAQNAHTRKQAFKLYKLARHYEAKSNFQKPVGATLTRQPVDELHHGLPLWFKEARASITCSQCGSKTGCYWYRKVNNTHVRCRLIPAVKRNNMDRVRLLISSAETLCRRCANGS